jgi:hypothetical protein
MFLRTPESEAAEGSGLRRLELPFRIIDPFVGLSAGNL